MRLNGRPGQCPRLRTGPPGNALSPRAPARFSCWAPDPDQVDRLADLLF